MPIHVITMSIFDKLFKRKKKENPQQNTNTEDVLLLPAINKIENSVSSLDFISQKEYLDLLGQYKSLKDQIIAVKNANMLSEYCEKHGIKEEDIKTFLSFFESSTYRDNHNERFLKKAAEENKDYLEHILDDCDPHIRLDEDQIKVVLTDEDNMLVIAGAGAGKTTTVAAKVKYLVDKKSIDPKDILVISFTNKAVDELKERINKKLGIPCKISTFHRVGIELINTDDEKKAVKEENFLGGSVREYLKTKILNDKNMASKILLFFATYLDLPPKFDMTLDEFFNYTAKNDFETMRGDLKAYADKIAAEREGTRRTIRNERVASYQELQIANFLFINGIDYRYEDPYKYHIDGSHKIYTPDFHIFQDGKEAYLEHFGMISDKGTNSNRPQVEIDKYIAAIKDKIELHKQHGTVLLKTFGGYSDGKDIVEHLRIELEKNGFKLHQRSEEEILSQIINSEQNRYIGKLIKLVMSFIEAFKTNGYNSGYFKVLRGRTKNDRDKIFLDICEGAYNNYQNDLKINYAIDFSDMINESVETIRRMQAENERIPYKYIIVDEYQDISHQRYNLTSELSKICDAKIVAVGDDWQSIYAFSGSDITLFTEFKKNIKDPRLGCIELFINNTYRNAQELINIAGRFVLKNTTQFDKSLKSPKRLDDPVIIYSYCDDEKKIKEQGLRNSMFQKANALEAILDKLVAEDPSILNRDEGKEPILLIGRFGFDAEKLAVGDLKDDFNAYKSEEEEEKEPYNIFDYYENGRRVVSKKYPTLRMAFMTAHSSKGLTYDNVIIINGMNDLNGFPSKREDDPVMDLVIKRDRAIDYAEERRLFYVALTRTSNRVYILAPERRPSEFVTELITDKGYTHITVKGVFNETLEKKHVLYCPDCGFPLKYRGNASLGLPLYICSNEHELCGFMSNDIKGGRLRVCECSECMDGYMIVKKQTDSPDYFLGCTNYTKDGKGCNHTISFQEFERLFPKTDIKRYTPEEVVNRDPLKYQGGNIEHINTTKAVKTAQVMREEKEAKKEAEKALPKPKKQINVEELLSNDLVAKIRQKCKKHGDLIEERVVDTKGTVAYLKKTRSWYWFVIDLVSLTFKYRYLRTEDYISIEIKEESLDEIYQIIETLLTKFYKGAKKSDVPVIEKPEEEKKPQKNLLSSGSQEQKKVVKDFTDWVTSNYSHIRYVNMYGIHQFRVEGKGMTALFWFALEDGVLLFKYRTQTVEKEKPKQIAVDLFDTNELYSLAKKLIETNQNP